MGRPKTLSPNEAKKRERDQKRAWKLANPDKERMSRLSRYAKNRDEIRKRVRIYESTPAYKQRAFARGIKKRFGLTPEQYEAKLAAQHDVCAICKKPCSTGRRLAISHFFYLRFNIWKFGENNYESSASTTYRPGCFSQESFS